MIYIGTFLHMTSQQEKAESERRHGEFSMLLQAQDADAALERFKQRITEIRTASGLFEGQCRIYIVQLLELDQVPQAEPMMLNFKSFAGDPLMPYIGCSVPSEHADTCRIFNWHNGAPEIDGEHQKLFMEFKH